MKAYKRMLISRVQKAEQSQPFPHDEPLTTVQYRNKLAVQHWREKLAGQHVHEETNWFKRTMLILFGIAA